MGVASGRNRRNDILTPMLENIVFFAPIPQIFIKFCQILLAIRLSIRTEPPSRKKSHPLLNPSHSRHSCVAYNVSSVICSVFLFETHFSRQHRCILRETSRFYSRRNSFSHAYTLKIHSQKRYIFSYKENLKT
jgi:hypothetical protein